MSLTEIIILVPCVIGGIGLCVLLDRFLSKFFKQRRRYKKGENILTALPAFTGKILYNGEEMPDFDYRAVIPTMKEENPDFMEFGFEDNFYISVYAFFKGIAFQIPKKDGSEWSTYSNPVAAETACDYVEKFLNGETDWMSEMEWEQDKLPSREAGIRFLVLLAGGFSLVMLAKWIMGLFVK